MKEPHVKHITSLESRLLGHPGKIAYVVSFEPGPEYSLDEYDQRILSCEALRPYLLIGRSADTSGIMTLTFTRPLKEVKEALRRSGDLPELVAIMPDVAVPLQR